MVKNSTLFYLVDDINLTSDILLSTTVYTLWDEKVDSMLNMLEYDPGENLVSQTLHRANVE